MNMHDIMAVIDLGSASSVGMLGYKDADNVVHPTAFVEEPSLGNIRHGYVYNVDGTAALIKRIVTALDKNLEENLTISQVYVGVGAQSLSTTEYIVSRSFPEEIIISEELIQEFTEEVERVYTEGRETLMITAPFFIVNGMQALRPQGMPCREIEAVFQIVSARSSIKRNVQLAVEKAGLGFAGLLVSPIALAEVTLSAEERILGCSQIDLGAGCTSVCIYKSGTLAMLQVLPMGGANVTMDLTSLRLVEADAEALKLDSASMNIENDKEKTLSIKVPDRQTERVIKYYDIGKLTAARMKEILANIVNIIKISNLQNTLDAGMQVGGGGAQLDGFIDYLTKELQAVNPIQLRHDLISWDLDEALRPKLYTAIGLLRMANMACTTNKRPWSEYVDETLQKSERTETDDLATDPWSRKGENADVISSGITIEHNSNEKNEEKKGSLKKKKSEEKKTSKIGAIFGDKINRLFDFLGDGDETDNNTKN
ncbi:cell division FtsA domain-containing protein [Porphyromonas crevioricanis]|nr:cell division FtsA domain-containing protein [Porphyromonas crevioricanis]SJZ98195.1 cell division protein FtsA [Porphyromonas crevioricanis]